MSLNIHTKTVIFNKTAPEECRAFVGQGAFFTTKEGRQVDIYEIKQNSKVYNPVASLPSHFLSSKLVGKQPIESVNITIAGWTENEIIDRAADIFFSTMPSNGSEKVWIEGTIKIKKGDPAFIDFELKRTRLKRDKVEAELMVLSNERRELEKTSETAEKQIAKLTQAQQDIIALCETAIAELQMNNNT